MSTPQHKDFKLRARLAVCFALLFSITACSTLVERGNREMDLGRHEKARVFYLRALVNERDRCGAPDWNGSRYMYSLDSACLSSAVRGMADSYRAQGMRDEALYYYFYYVQICLRHGLDFAPQAGAIREYVMEGGRKDGEEKLNEIIKGI